jgi:glucokinase
MDASSGTVSTLNVPSWRGFPLRRRVQEYVGAEVVLLENDAKALALGEMVFGSGAQNFLGGVVSTGVGGGIVVDGRMAHGIGGNAGHFGHIEVVAGGRLCGCGARGCLEAEISGIACRNALGVDPPDAPIEWRLRCGQLLGKALSDVANTLAISHAYIGGSIALGWGEPFFNSAREVIRERCRLDFSSSFVVVPPTRAHEAPILGASALVREYVILHGLH